MQYATSSMLTATAFSAHGAGSRCRILALGEFLHPAGPTPLRIEGQASATSPHFMPRRTKLSATNRHAGPAGSGLEDSLAAAQDLGTASSQTPVAMFVTCLSTMCSYQQRSCPIHNRVWPKAGVSAWAWAPELWMPNDASSCLLDLHYVRAIIIA